MPPANQSVWHTNIMAPGESSSSVCKFAKSVPKLRIVRDQKEMNKRSRERNAIVSLVDYVMKNTHQAPDIWQTIQSGGVVEVGSASSGAGQEQCDNLGCASFRKVTRDFKVQCFLSLGGLVDKTVFEAMHLTDPHGIDDVFTCLFKIDVGDRIAPECQGPRVLALALRYRQEEIKRNVNERFAASVNESGEVDWLAKPLFKLHWRKGILAKVTHCNGDTTGDVQMLHSHEKYTLENPCSDLGACFTWKGSKHFVSKMFDADTGPNKHLLDKNGAYLKSLYKKAADEIQKKRDAVKALCDAPADLDLGQRDKRQREAALQAARANRQPSKRMRALALRPHNSDA